MNKITGSFRFVAALFYALGCILLVLIYLQWVDRQPHFFCGYFRTQCDEARSLYC